MGDVGMWILEVIWSPNVKRMAQSPKNGSMFLDSHKSIFCEDNNLLVSAWNTTRASVYGTLEHLQNPMNIMKVESMFPPGLLQVELDGRRVIAVPVDTWQGDFRLTALK